MWMLVVGFGCLLFKVWLLLLELKKKKLKKKKNLKGAGD